MRVFYILFFFTLALSLCEARFTHAKAGVAYVDFEESYLLRFAPDGTPTIAYSLNPAIYSQDLFLTSPSGDENFILSNLSFQMKSIKSPKSGDLINSESLILNSEFTATENLSLLGRVKTDVPQSADIDPRYSLEIGPALEVEDIKVRAYYNRAGAVDRLGSQGVFMDLNYQPSSWASFDIVTSSQWRSAVNRDDINISRGLFKTAIAPFGFARFTTGIDLNSTKSENFERSRYMYFANLDNTWKGYKTFIDYRLEKLDIANSHNDSDTNSLTAGISKIWNKIEAWVRGGLSRREARAEENTYFGEMGFNYNPFDDFNVQFNNSYERFNSEDDTDERIRLSGGINFKLPLPLGMECQNSIKLIKATEQDLDYQLTTSVVISRF